MVALVFVWEKHLNKHISIIDCELDWICGIKISNGVNRDYYILNVYLPYECEDHGDVFNDYLTKLNVVVLNINNTYITILGDFNYNIARRSLFGDILQTFCVDNYLIMVPAPLAPPLAPPLRGVAPPGLITLCVHQMQVFALVT